MVTIRNGGEHGLFVSYALSHVGDYWSAKDILCVSEIMPDGEYFPAAELSSAVAVLRLAGLTVEVEE